MGSTGYSRSRQALIALALAGSAMAAHAAEFHGQVVIGGVPVPGATVTATRAGKTVTTVTDSQGLYQFADLADGDWHITVEILGFKRFEIDATVAANKPQPAIELQLLPMDTLLATTHATTVTPEAPPTPALVARTTADARKKKSDKPSQTAMAEQGEKSGAASQDGLLINGSENNANTTKYSQTQGFGNTRKGSRSLYNGGVAVIAQNAVFNAAPYSLTGLDQGKPDTNLIHGTLSVGGPLNIPHILPRGPYFFLNYDWQRSSIATTLPGLVPTLAQRGCTTATAGCVGQFANLTGLTNANGGPLSLVDPTTGLPISGTQVPISGPAQALLALYPLPNLAGNTRYNYQTQVLNNNHTDAVQGRLNKGFGQRDSVYGGFAFQSARADAANLFHFRDVTNTLGVNGNVNWSHRFPHGIYVTSRYEFSRQRTEVRPQFEGVTNVSGDAGILANNPAAGIVGNSQAVQDWGPPSLGFSGGIYGLSDANSQFTRNRTDSLHLEATQTRGRHTFEVGGEFRRQEYNYFGQQNPRGSFTFTGTATGNDFADFLTGYPDNSQVAFGNADKYLRQSVSNLYINDDWRLRPELTIVTGLRWDYGSPMTELKNRLVNIDQANNFAQSAPVLASGPRGPVSGISLPNSLVRPDRRGFEPRIAIAWRPLPASTLVIRAGYGVYDDTSTYLSAYQQMDQQAPLSNSVSASRSAACPLTLANGFLNCAGTTASVFGIDPNFRVGYAQTWQLSAQRDLPGAMVATVTYLGIKGTRGMQEFLPNTYPDGGANPNPAAPVGYLYETSNGNSTRESGQVQLRRRLRAGFTATAQYTFSKSIDNDSQIGGSGHVVGSAGGTAGTAFSTEIAQDWRNLRAERGLSSFDQRHLVTATVQYTTGMGLGGHTLLNGWRGRVIKEWTASTNFNVGSGLPENPVYLETVNGTGYTGFTRPNVTGQPLYRTSSTPVGYFLNASAFAAPAAGQWGDARRNSITGPEQFQMDASLVRTFRLKDPYNLDIRVDATNVINHVNYAGYVTTVNSTTFGQPTSANGMRTLRFTGRLRF